MILKKKEKNYVKILMLMEVLLQMLENMMKLVN